MMDMQHILLIPDGNRRHAKREYLCSLLRNSKESLESTLKSISPGDASILVDRLAVYLQTGRDQGPDESADILDFVSVKIPEDYLLRSYFKSGLLIEELLRSCMDDRSLDILTVFGMQTRNLARSNREVLAFLQVESVFARHWANSFDIASRCRFRVIGNNAALEKLETPALRKAAREYVGAATMLQEAGQGGDLCVNILAPYDYLWEIEIATQSGRFERDQLAISDDVNLVIRTGSIGRSPTSGALPLQVAFSRLDLISDYFPDCTVGDLRSAIHCSEDERPESGL
jgi:undecaprenyl pyrophosphate synthase